MYFVSIFFPPSCWFGLVLIFEFAFLYFSIKVIIFSGQFFVPVLT